MGYPACIVRPDPAALRYQHVAASRPGKIASAIDGLIGDVG